MDYFTGSGHTAFRQFDYETISDLIVHIRYTADEGGSAFRTRCQNALKATMAATKLTGGHQGLYVACSVRDTFVNEWWQLKETGATTLTIESKHLPYMVRDHSPAITAYTWAAKVKGSPATFDITVDGVTTPLPKDAATLKPLCVGNAGTAGLGTPMLLACNATHLEDLTLFVSYTIA